MDTKTKRIEPGNPLDCERLIERGHLALAAITSEAHAARVEALKAELEVALAEAQSGEPSHLLNWLASYRGISESPLIPLSTVQPPLNSGQFQEARELHVASELSQVESAAKLDHPTQAVRSWDRLISGARQRLELHHTEANASVLEQHLAPSDPAADNKLPALAGDASSPANTSLLNGTPTEARLQEGHPKESRPPESRPPESRPPESQPPESQLEESLSQEPQQDCANGSKLEIAEEELAEAQPSCEEDEEDLPAHGLEQQEHALEFHELEHLQVLADVERDLDKPLSQSGRRGLIVSVAVHGVLIAALMAITMRIPPPPASLGFESGSSELATEALDNLDPIEITAPQELTPEMPNEVSESSVSLPSAVGLASSTTANSSASVTTGASGVSGMQASANRAVSASGGRPNPAHSNASFFGAAASGNCFCYVIDGSESMRGGPWEAAKAELLRSLSTMKENHRFYIIFFNQELNAIPMPGEREPATSPLYATEDNLKHARNWIESLRIDRGAPPNDALLHAIELEPDAIYLLADGATKIDVPAFLRTKNRTSDLISGEQVRVPIHAIAFYSPETGQRLMKQVAMENKGQFIYVPAPRKK